MPIVLSRFRPLYLFGLKNFINSISKGVDDKLFSSASRCSKAKSDVSVNVKVFDNTRLNKIIGSALKIVKNNNYLE